MFRRNVPFGSEVQKRKPAEGDSALIEKSAGFAEINVFGKL